MNEQLKCPFCSGKLTKIKGNVFVECGEYDESAGEFEYEATIGVNKCEECNRTCAIAEDIPEDIPTA